MVTRKIYSSFLMLHVFFPVQKQCDFWRLPHFVSTPSMQTVSTFLMYKIWKKAVIQIELTHSLILFWEIINWPHWLTSKKYFNLWCQYLMSICPLVKCKMACKEILNKKGFLIISNEYKGNWLVIQKNITM